MALVLQGFDLIADHAGFFFRIPRASHRWLDALFIIGEQRFAETAFIMRDEMRSCRENVPCRAIVSLKAHDDGAGKIFLKTQNIIHFRAAPAIDRLIIIADAGDILPALRNQTQPEILRCVGVLILVDENIFEAFLPALQHVRMLAEEAQIFEQKIAEISGI